MPPDERDTPLNTPAGQILLGARDVIAEEAFRVVTDPCDIPDPGQRPVVPILITPLPSGTGAFMIRNGPEPIFTIHFDGRIEVNPAFTVDEAARAFWDAVARMNPWGPL